MGDLTKNFSRAEFACKCGCGADHISIELVEILQKIREDMDTPLVINSGVRCVEHNRKEGGRDDSAHLSGLAVDIKCLSGYTRNRLLNLSWKYGIKRRGIAKTFIHIDIDSKKPQDVVWVY